MVIELALGRSHDKVAYSKFRREDILCLAAIMKSSKNLEGAAVLVNFMLSTEFQQFRFDIQGSL